MHETSYFRGKSCHLVLTLLVPILLIHLGILLLPKALPFCSPSENCVTHEILYHFLLL